MKKSLKNAINWILSLTLVVGMLPVDISYAADSELTNGDENVTYAEELTGEKSSDGQADRDFFGEEEADGSGSRGIDPALFNKIDQLNGVSLSRTYLTSPIIPGGNIGLDYNRDLTSALQDPKSLPQGAPDLSPDETMNRYRSYCTTKNGALVYQYSYYLDDEKAVIDSFAGSYYGDVDNITSGQILEQPVFWLPEEVLEFYNNNPQYSFYDDEGVAFINDCLGKGQIDGITSTSVSASDMKLINIRPSNIDSIIRGDNVYSEAYNNLPDRIYMLEVLNQDCVPAGHTDSQKIYYKTRPVAGIADGAFAGKDRISLVRVEGNEDGFYIGTSAFEGCTDLVRLFLYNCWIGDRAFKSCKKYVPMEVTETEGGGSVWYKGILKGIRYIGIEAFSDCDAITHFKIYTEATNTEPLEIGFGALSNCDKLKKICIYGYASLGDYAMYNCPDFSLIACNSRGSFLSVDGESDVFLTWDQRENAGYLLGIGKGCFAMPSSGADNSETIRICDIAVPDDPAGYIYYGADTELFLENTVFQGLKNGSEIDADMTLEQLKTSCAYSSSIGDFLFANRGSLKKAALVVSSCDLGKARVPMNSFRACKNLDWVYLRGLSYDANLFREVENDSFFVSGIMTYGSEAPGYSKERSCTWSAYTKAAEYICFKSDNILYQTSVPYYIEFPAFYSGHEYLFTLNSEQKLVSCNYIGKLSEDKFVGSDPKDPFTIPKEINGYTISIFVADALTSLKDHIEYLKISDGVGFYSLSFTDYILKGIEIGNGAIRLSNGFFKGCKSLKHVTVSDNLDSIGFNTFLDCPEGLIVTIPGMRTAISKAAFSPDKDVYICTPKDSVAYTITDAYNHENEKIHWIGYDPKLKHSVRFLNDDKQTTIDIQVVNNGTDAVSPNMADKKSSILSPSANFSHWEWKDPATGNVVSGDAAWKNITEDRDIWAVFIEPGSPDKETHTVNFLYDDGQTLIDTQEVEDGADAVSPNMADKKSMILSESANFAYWLWETPTGGVVSGDDALKSISENRDIRAVFVEPETQEKPIHTVNFFYDDGITPIETQEVEDGADAVSPNMADKHSMLLGSSAEFSHWEWHDPVADTVVSGDKALKSISENRDIRAVFVKAPEPGPGPRPDPDEGETGLEIYFAENGLKTISLVYTGDEQLPEVVVKLHGIRLKEGVDYSLKYGNNKNVSTTKKYGKVTISGMGRFCKKHELYFTITPKELGDENGNPAEGIMIAGLSLKTGAKPKPKLFYNGREISKKEYSWFWNQSDDSVSFSAKAGGNYSGSIKAQLLTRLNADEYERYGIKVKLNASYKVFNGRSQTLSEDELLVTDASGLVRLKKDADYTVSYIGDTVNAGKVEFAVCGIGDYHGSVTKSYSIRPAKDAVFLITLVPEEDGSLVYSYKKSGVCPEVVVTTRFDGRVYTLKQGTEYTLRYKGNKQIGNAASCNFRFIGNFKGAKKAKKRFAIKRADLENAQIYVGDMKYTGPGKYRSKPVVIQNGEVVPQGEYQLMYLDGSDSELSGRLTLAPGEERLIRVKVVGKNKKYTGQCGFAEYRIRNNSVLTDISGSKLKLSSRYGAGIIKNVQYNGRPIIFSTDYDKRQADLMLWLKKDYSYMSEEIERHFEVVYADNVEPGKATVLLIPLDSEEYSGICKGTFRIKKKKLQEMK